MRLATLFALLALAPALHAQAVPDTTAPWRYFPLDVGHRVEILYQGPPTPPDVPTAERFGVTRNVAVGGERYAEFVYEAYHQSYPAPPALIVRTAALVRYDTASARLVTPEGIWNSYPCSLDAAFNSDVDCGAGALYQIYGGPDRELQIGGGNLDVVTASVKSFDRSPFGGYTLAEGIGIVGFNAELSPFFFSVLHYVRTGAGVEYGTPISGLPLFVAGETDAMPAPTLALTAAPNPTAGPLTLALTLPAAETVTVEAFDALGRRVWQQTAALGAGPQTVSVDASAWAPGVYVVRASTGTASASARIVRR